MEDEFIPSIALEKDPELTDEVREMLEKQNSKIHMVTESDKIKHALKIKKIEKEAEKNWNMFYKRNTTNFFKDRSWTTREFEELLGSEESNERKVLLEVGCGVGNLVFPLISENRNNFFIIYACDFSTTAIELVKKNELYDENRIKAFQCDITLETIFDQIPRGSVDIITMVFVLSAVHPEKFNQVALNLHQLLKPGGVLLFRDYGLYDMAQLRFKSSNKIGENFYVRQDGTCSYFFSLKEAKELYETAAFEILQNNFIERRTVNKKEDVDVKRWFIQGKYQKPER